MASGKASNNQQPTWISSDSGSPDSSDSGAPSPRFPRRRVTEKPPAPVLNGGCHCKQSCNSAQCACRKRGQSCMSCPCVHWMGNRSPCCSPFLRLKDIFGPPRTEPWHTRPSIPSYLELPSDLQPFHRLERTIEHAASPCFAKHLNKKSQKIEPEALKTMLTADCEAYQLDPFLAAWRVRYNSAERQNVGSDNILKLLQERFRHALSREHHDREARGEDVRDTYIWSFCRDGWVEFSKVQHCQDCGKCYADSWHCVTCNTCKAGRQLACNRCGGWSSIGAEEGQEGEVAVDAATVQGGKGGSARKRPRRGTQMGESSETSKKAPDDIASRDCQCRDQCDTRKCVCRRWGKSCGEGCKCVGAEFGCFSPMSGQPRSLFGEEYSNLRIYPCLTDAIERSRYKKISVNEIEAKLLKDQRVFQGKLLDENETMDEMGFGEPLAFASTTISFDSEAAFTTTIFEEASDRRELKEWYEKYQTLKDEPLSSSDRKNHMQWLFRYALAQEEEGGEKKYKKYHFSYCRGEWFTSLSSPPLTHCSDCHTCRDPYWWHCGVCRKCNIHYKWPCEGCGGFSSTMSAERKEAKEERWTLNP